MGYATIVSNQSIAELNAPILHEQLSYLESLTQILSSQLPRVELQW